MEHLTVKMRIKGAYRDMNPKEKQIADYILENIITDEEKLKLF